MSLKGDSGHEDTSSLTMCSPPVMNTRPECRHTPGRGEVGRTGRRETEEKQDERREGREERQNERREGEEEE